MTVAAQIAKRHFGAKMVNKLKKSGITVTSTQAYKVTYPNGSWGYETAYVLNDNGTSKVKTYEEVIAIG